MIADKVILELVRLWILDDWDVFVEDALSNAPMLDAEFQSAAHLLPLCQDGNLGAVLTGAILESENFARLLKQYSRFSKEMNVYIFDIVEERDNDIESEFAKRLLIREKLYIHIIQFARYLKLSIHHIHDSDIFPGFDYNLPTLYGNIDPMFIPMQYTTRKRVEIETRIERLSNNQLTEIDRNEISYMISRSIRHSDILQITVELSKKKHKIS